MYLRSAGFFAAALLVLNGLAAAQQVSVDCAQKRQTIDGLGTCGMHWTAGDMYANKELPERVVNDLGLTLQRICIPPVLPAEVSDPKDITYKKFDWGKPTDPKETSMQYVAAIYAKNPAEVKVVGSVWSPPAWMKTNNSTKKGGHLKPEYVRHFAKYLAEWVLYMKEVHKVPVFAISPQNELSFVEPYDSCQYTPEEYHALVAALAETFKAMKLDTKIFGPEDMTQFPDRLMKFVTPLAKDPACQGVFKYVASHGYSDGIQAAGSASDNTALWKSVQPLGLECWMSETSGDEPNWLGGESKDKKGRSRPGGLNLALRMHNALVYGHMSGWIYWCISGNVEKGKDAAAGESLMNMSEPNKKYFVSKHFFKFIRPGAVCVETSGSSEDPLQASAYLHAKNKTLTIILINRAEKEAEVSVAVKAGPAIRTYETYRTSATDDCKKLDDIRAEAGKLKITLPAQSMATLFGKAAS